MPFADDSVYSTTIDRTKKGRGFVNILAHDPPAKEELGQAPAMEPLKHFTTADQASEHAATRAQHEYDDMRNDPNSNWYVPQEKKTMFGYPGTSAPDILDKMDYAQFTGVQDIQPLKDSTPLPSIPSLASLGAGQPGGMIKSGGAQEPTFNISPSSGSDVIGSANDNPLQALNTGMKALDMSKLHGPIEVAQHHERLLNTGPYEQAAQRHAIWSDLAAKTMNG